MVICDLLSDAAGKVQSTVIPLVLGQSTALHTLLKNVNIINTMVAEGMAVGSTKLNIQKNILKDPATF